MHVDARLPVSNRIVEKIRKYLLKGGCVTANENRVDLGVELNSSTQRKRFDAFHGARKELGHVDRGFGKRIPPLEPFGKAQVTCE